MLSPTFFAQALVSFLEERLGHHQRGLISALYIPCALARAALPEFSFFFFFRLLQICSGVAYIE